MPTSEVLSILFGLAVGWWIIIFFIILYLKAHRRIADMGTSKIRSAAQGLVELEGIARHLDGKDSSEFLTARKTIHYLGGNTGKEDKYCKRTVHKGSIFVIDDGTGQVQVDPRNVEHQFLTIKRYQQAYSEVPCPADNQFSDLHRNLNNNAPRKWFGKRNNVTELSLSAGDKVFVHGAFSTTTADDGITVTHKLAPWNDGIIAHNLELHIGGEAAALKSIRRQQLIMPLPVIFMALMTYLILTEIL